MKFENQITLILLAYIFSFLYIRVFLNGIKRYIFNTKAYRKIRDSETIWSWFTYEKYKNVIPTWLILLYYSIVVSHIVALLLCFLCNFNIIHINIGEQTAKAILGFDVAWIIILAILFWSPRPGFAYDRWIKKKGK